jgi:Ca2+-binding EF-hand superfamily protein
LNRLTTISSSFSISSDELGELLQIVGIQATQDELDAMIKQIDVDNSGDIDFEGMYSGGNTFRC